MDKRVKTILVIRFSSFGDIIQSLSSVVCLKHSNPELEITFLTKKEFFEIVKACPFVDKVLLFDKADGFFGLIKLAFSIRANKYDYLYDAHCNLRTRFIKIINLGTKIFIRKKERIKRILLFKFRKNYFPSPFIGVLSYIEPLKSLIFNYESHKKISYTKDNLIFQTTNLNQYKNKIVLCPSAAWDTKRWPIEKWNELIQLLLSSFKHKNANNDANNEQNTKDIVILAGPNDFFCKDFEKLSSRVVSLAGMTSFIESCEIIKQAKFVISGDTGLIHVADFLGVRGIELIGPSAFGYVYSDSIHVVEKEMACKPCSKDGSNGCTQKIYKQCMQEISVDQVFNIYKTFIK